MHTVTTNNYDGRESAMSLSPSRRRDATPAGPGGFADRFNQLKGDRSLRELARQLSESRLEWRISAQALHKWSSGKSTPDPDDVVKLASFFGVPPAALLFGTENHGDGLSPAAKQLAKAWETLPKKYKLEMRREILLLAHSFRPKQPNEDMESFYRALDSAVRELQDE
jgi:transcriptional regulator with XRE-family HTH domain